MCGEGGGRVGPPSAVPLRYYGLRYLSFTVPQLYGQLVQTCLRCCYCPPSTPLHLPCPPSLMHPQEVHLEWKGGLVQKKAAEDTARRMAEEVISMSRCCVCGGGGGYGRRGNHTVRLVFVAPGSLSPEPCTRAVAHCPLSPSPAHPALPRPTLPRPARPPSPLHATRPTVSTSRACGIKSALGTPWRANCARWRL